MPLPTLVLLLLLLLVPQVNFVALADAQPGEAQSAPSTPRPSSSTNAPDKHVRVDPSYPLRLGEVFYPPDSKLLGEEGICTVRLLVSADGTIPVVQLVATSGYARLDSACRDAFIDARLLPATSHGVPVTTWVNVPITWVLSANHRPLSTGDVKSTPHFSDDDRPEVGWEHYPVEALQLHQEGYCLVQGQISESGTPSNVAVFKSTGFETLNQACVEAIQHGHFVPAERAGTPVSADAEFLLDWRFGSH